MSKRKTTTKIPTPESFSGSEYSRRLDKNARERVDKFAKQLMLDTNGRLYPGEIEQYAIMMYIIDLIDAEMALLGIAGVDAGLVETGRKYRDALLSGLRKVREDDRRPPSVQAELQLALKEMENDGTPVKSWVSEKNLDETDAETGEDSGSGGTIEDENPI